MALVWLCTPESMPSICLQYGLGVALGGFRGFRLQDTFARGRVSAHNENCWYQGHLRRMSGVSQTGTPLPPNNPKCHLPGLPAVDEPRFFVVLDGMRGTASPQPPGHTAVAPPEGRVQGWRNRGPAARLFGAPSWVRMGLAATDEPCPHVESGKEV